MQKLVSLVLVSMFVLITAAGCGDDDGEEACAAYAVKCPAGSAGSQTCSADRINDASNGDDVEDCIENAADCNAANACLATLK